MLNQKLDSSVCDEKLLQEKKAFIQALIVRTLKQEKRQSHQNIIDLMKDCLDFDLSVCVCVT